jgi:hypothetical protein
MAIVSSEISHRQGRNRINRHRWIWERLRLAALLLALALSSKRHRPRWVGKDAAVIHHMLCSFGIGELAREFWISAVWATINNDSGGQRKQSGAGISWHPAPIHSLERALRVASGTIELLVLCPLVTHGR